MSLKKQLDRLTARATMAALPVRDAKVRLQGLGMSLWTPPVARSPFDNVFHCCVQRTGSRWMLRVLSDAITYRYSGLTLEPFPATVDRLRRDAAGRPRFPRVRPRTIVGPLYYDHATFAQMPLPAGYRAFFVVRDPRDIVVSHYFSTRDTHRLNPQVAERRHILKGVGEEAGLRLTIDWLKAENLFGAIESWLEAQSNEAQSNPESTVRVYRYEDLTGDDQAGVLRELLAFVGVDLPDEAFERLCQKYSLKAMRGGREGEVVSNSHYRTGKAGGWEEHITEAVDRKLMQVLGPRVRELYAF